MIFLNSLSKSKSIKSGSQEMIRKSTTFIRRKTTFRTRKHSDDDSWSDDMLHDLKKASETPIDVQRIIKCIFVV